MSIKLIDNNPNEIGKFVHCQVELEKITDDVKDKLLEFVKKINPNLIPHDIDCQIIIEGIFKIKNGEEHENKNT